jgi:hypothetical protein
MYITWPIMLFIDTYMLGTWETHRLHFYKEKDQIFSLLVSLSSVLFETRRLTWPYGRLDNARWVSQVPNIYVSMNNMMGHVMYMYVREGFHTPKLETQYPDRDQGIT